jgi:ParB family transcriptional regulator, chromosome partitioning protein
MAEQLDLKDPHKGQALSVRVVPAGTLEVVSHQRKPSKPHVKSVATSIDKIGFLVPLVVVERDSKFVIIDGQHRFLAGKDLGVKEFPVVVVPEETAVRMMNLNVERQLNIRERAYVSLQIYRQFLDDRPNIPESDPTLEDAVELASNVTLGMAYEENGRLSGSAFEPILKRCDGFLDTPLHEASETRGERAAAVVEADRLVRSIAAHLKELGVESAYASAAIVSHVNPVKRTKEMASFDDTFEKLTAKLRDLDAEPEKARRVFGG